MYSVAALRPFMSHSNVAAEAGTVQVFSESGIPAYALYWSTVSPPSLGVIFTRTVDVEVAVASTAFGAKKRWEFVRLSWFSFPTQWYT